MSEIVEVQDMIAVSDGFTKKKERKKYHVFVANCYGKRTNTTRVKERF